MAFWTLQAKVVARPILPIKHLVHVESCLVKHFLKSERGEQEGEN